MSNIYKGQPGSILRQCMQGLTQDNILIQEEHLVLGITLSTFLKSH